MIEGITTTETTASGREVAVTRWTCGEYELVRTATADTDFVRWSIQAADWKLPSIHEQVADWDEPDVVTYGVNWSGCGTLSTREARDYAVQIEAAADAAEAFTAIRKAAK